MNEIEKVRKIFLTDVDEETAKENLEKINDWERGISENRAFLQWQELEITQRIYTKAKETYIEIGVKLSNDRRISNDERTSLWARQDAAHWIMNLISKDSRAELEAIDREIRNVINATKT